MQGMKFYHSKNIAHRDIKPENILVDMESPSLTTKIIDFGFAAQSVRKMDVFCGTPAYMSPEICNKEKYSGPATDMWATGILLYTILFGAQPFRASNEKDLFRKIISGKYHTPAMTARDRSASRSPSRSPRLSPSRSRLGLKTDPSIKFKEYKHIKNVGTIREILADILTTNEEKRLTADKVLQKYDKWLNI